MNGCVNDWLGSDGPRGAAAARGDVEDGCVDISAVDTSGAFDTSGALSMPLASGRGQGGFALPAVLAFLVMGTILTMAVLSFSSTALGVDRDISNRNSELAAERDAIEYALASTRYDAAKGVGGTSQTYSVAGVEVTCTGVSGSGVEAGGGRTDRTVECATRSIRTTVRFFDRSGAKVGVMTETLSWKVTG